MPASGWDCHVDLFDAAAATAAEPARPIEHRLAEIEALAAGLDVGHLVLIQPDVPGSDPLPLLDALSVEPGRHRGVVILDASVTDPELDALHRLGVRGVRFNLHGPNGEGTDFPARFAALGPRLRDRGWHIEWSADAADLDRIADLHERSDVACVLGHLDGLTADLADDDPAWSRLARLASLSAWVKLSGWSRLGSSGLYDDLETVVRRVASLFGDRLVWGSNWPHGGSGPEAMTDYAATWTPLADALGQAASGRLRNRVPLIYR